MRRDLSLGLLLLMFIATTWAYLGSCGDAVFHGIPGFMKAQHSVPKRPCEEFQPRIATVFAKLDREGKGYISKADIDRAILSDRSIKGDDAAALYALRQVFDLLAIKGNNGVLQIGPVELQRFHKTLPAAAAQQVDDHMTHARNLLSKVNRNLYPSGTLQQSLDKMRSVHQVHRGNCYFESGCGSMAAIDPQRIRDMITDNGVDSRGIRTYTVRFARAPTEAYVVDDLTDTTLLVNDVEEDSGIWLTVLVRAYGMYQREHPWVRMLQRAYFGLNKAILPEDITDQGSMFSDGLRMCTPLDTRIKQNTFKGGVDKALVKKYLSDGLVDALRASISQLEKVDQTALADYLGPYAPRILAILKQIDEKQLRGPVADMLVALNERVMTALLYQDRDPAKVHEQLKHSICDEHLPATVVKYGGAHEASIIHYQPGTVTADGKHTSKFGFVTIHDQAGLSEEENAMLKSGKWWRDAGMDDQTICMSVEEFTAFYTGYNSAVRKR